MRLSASRLVIIGVGVVAVLLLLVVLTRRSGTDAQAAPSTASDASASSTTASSTPAPDEVAVAGQQPGQSASAAAAGLGAPTTELPVQLTVSNTDGLRAGNVVSVRAVADAGSAVYGLEARLCAADSPANYDADLYPTVSGNCIVDPLSADTDDHVVVAGTPPYQTVDLAFRVGTGSDTFTTQAGGTATITCDAAHPCQLSVKVQIPYGFGFRTYPLTFA